MNDTELLREYARNRSEVAFAELVKRYIDFVHSTARRQVSDDQTAEEVAQNVFCLLARKARDLTGYRTLGGWLYRTTCFIASRAVRSDQRRKKREQEVVNMSVEASDAKTEAVWEQLAPSLDEALNQLGEQDRLALLLRFFQEKPMREVGETLGVSEAAAKMRVARSVERLRTFFAKRGVACSAAAMVLALSKKSTSAAPAGLAGRITTQAMAGTVGAIGAFSLGQLVLQFSLMTLGAVGIVVLTLFAGGVGLYAHVRHQQYGNTDDVSPLMAAAPSTNSSAARLNYFSKSSGNFSANPPAAPAIDVEDLLAELRIALHRTNDSVAPGNEVVAITRQFGPHGSRAFALLKEEAGLRDDKADSTDPGQLAPHRAICAMGFLDKFTPGVVDYLWNVFKEAPKITESADYLALIALSNLGFEPPDIQLLSERVLAEKFDDHSDAFIKHQVVEWISDVIKTNSAAGPYVSSVEKLLDDSDAGVRFWAACALIEHEGGTNPRVFSEVIAGLKSASADRLGWASLMLKEIGAPAKPITPVLIAAARATDSENSRDWALSAVGNIDPGWRGELPEVNQVLTKDEQEQAFLDKINSGTATVDDLIPSLKEKGRVHVAAITLGSMGAAAGKAVPEMIQALSISEDDESFRSILDAIQKINPQAALKPDDARAVLLGALEKNGNEATFNLFKTNGGWCAKSGAGNFAKQLVTVNPAASDVYISSVLKKNPDWKGVFEAR